jgi:hypothetical protein
MLIERARCVKQDCRERSARDGHRLDPHCRTFVMWEIVTTMEYLTSSNRLNSTRSSARFRDLRMVVVSLVVLCLFHATLFFANTTSPVRPTPTSPILKNACSIGGLPLFCLPWIGNRSQSAPWAVRTKVVLQEENETEDEFVEESELASVVLVDQLFLPSSMALTSFTPRPVTRLRC